jgi:3-oxoacyl-[acyl-carrier-protein] synthase-3
MRKPGIVSIGWDLPAGRQRVDEVAAAFGVSAQALRDFGLEHKVVPGPDDHPSTLAARATRAALAAGGLTASDVDLLIFTGNTRDRPAPWVAAVGVAAEIGANAASFDLGGRCPGLIEGMWIGAELIRGGSFRTVVVCCGDRFDYLLPATPAEPSIANAVHSAGGAAVVLSASAPNQIVARAHYTREDLVAHTASTAPAGGSRWPLDTRVLAERGHLIRDTATIVEIGELKAYLRRAEKRNLEEVCAAAGFDEIDFIAGSAINVKDNASSLAALGIGPDKYLMTMPRFGHVGASAALISIGNAIQEGRAVGPRLVVSLRTNVYCNALAIHGESTELGIRVAGPRGVP